MLLAKNSNVFKGTSRLEIVSLLLWTQGVVSSEAAIVEPALFHCNLADIYIQFLFQFSNFILYFFRTLLQYFEIVK